MLTTGSNPKALGGRMRRKKEGDMMQKRDMGGRKGKRKARTPVAKGSGYKGGRK